MNSLKRLLRVEYLLLIAILLFGAYLRLYKIEQIPNGLYSDEASLGYNAYSILLTGKDEYGKAFPLYFRSFGDYLIPMYVYLTTIAIHFFGLSIWSVRLVSAICGTISIFVVYLILTKLPLFHSRFMPLIGALLFATAPWAIYFSRAAFETNVALTIVLLALYTFLLAEKRKWLYVLSVFLFSLSTFAYHSERLVVYILVPGLTLLLYKPKTIKAVYRKEIVIAFVLFVLTQLPHLIATAAPAFKVRAAGLFYKDAILDQAEKIARVIPEIIAVPLAFTREFLSQFFVYFSPRNLFFNADSERERSIPEMSVLFPWLVIPYLVGLFIFASKLKSRHIQYLLVFMISCAAIPALTKDPFASTRALPLIFPLLVIILLGIDQLLATRLRLGIIVLTPLLILMSGVLFWRSYFVLFPNERARTWLAGYEQLADQIKRHPTEKYIIDQSRIKPAYIELVFFLQYPPSELQKAVDQTIKDNYYTNIKFNSHYKFANIETRPILWEPDVYTDRVIVGDELSISKEQAEEHVLEKVFEIRDPTDYMIFQGYKTNPKAKCEKTNYEVDLCSRWR